MNLLSIFNAWESAFTKRLNKCQDREHYFYRKGCQEEPLAGATLFLTTEATKKNAKAAFFNAENAKKNAKDTEIFLIVFLPLSGIRTPLSL